MEREQTPKCIRQIGRPQTALHIYVEDYVKSFLGHLCEEAFEDGCAAALFGTERRTETGREVYLYGAVRMDGISHGTEPQIDETTADKMAQAGSVCFPGAKLLGWFYRSPSCIEEDRQALAVLHGNYFAKQRMYYLEYEWYERELLVYMYENYRLKELPGYYIYYEKNVEMQEYMVEHQSAPKETPKDPTADAIRRMFREEELRPAATRKRERKARKAEKRSARREEKRTVHALEPPKQEALPSNVRRIRSFLPPMPVSAVSELSPPQIVLPQPKSASSRLTVVTVGLTVLFFVLLGMFIVTQYDDMEHAVESVRTFSQQIFLR